MRKLLLLAVVAVSLVVTAAAAAKTVTVTITTSGYVPKSTTIAAGDAVHFVNSDTAAHQVVFKTMTGVTCTPNPIVLQPTQTATCTFASAGTYTYSDPNVKGKTFKGTVVVTAAPPAGTSVTLSVSPQTVIYGSKVTLSGTLSTHRQGETVNVLARACGESVAKRVVDVTTTAGGAYTAQVKPLKNTVYTVKVKNTASSPVTVKVRPRLSLGRVAAHRYLVRAYAARSFAGKYASFQRYKVALSRWVAIRRVLLRPNTNGLAPTVISSRSFTSRIKAGLKVRIVLGTAQVGSCYLAGKSRTIRS
jgi:plastocyanin